MKMWMRTEILLASALMPAMTGMGCRKVTPAAPPSAQVPIASVEVRRDAGWLYTHVGPDGHFVTTDKPDEIPPVGRRLARAIDPAMGSTGSGGAAGKGAGKDEGGRHDATHVYVVDIDELLRAGRAKAKSMSREAFETGALAQLPPGVSSMLSERPGVGVDPSTPSAPGAEELPPVGDPAAAPVVTVYGTSWCGACREARAYLRSKKVPFVDKDVERDAGAARELAAKGARLGVPTDRVPILDVRGRLLVGFDRARLDALLGEAT